MTPGTTPEPETASSPIPRVFPTTVFRGFVLLMCCWTASSCGGGSPAIPRAGIPPPPPPAPPLIGSPCPGVEVRGEPTDRGASLAGAALIIEWEKGSVGSFDWSEPYFDLYPDEDDGRDLPMLEMSIAEWRVETTNRGTRHTLDLRWPPFREVGLYFRAAAAACDRPSLACGATGCELRP